MKPNKPQKQLKSYQYKEKNGFVSIKLDLNNISEKDKIIKDLEMLLDTLKK
jgi:hypothetical protein